jgi:hypothetical protein
VSAEKHADGQLKGPVKIWLPIVLTLGVLAGLVLSYSITVPYGWRFIPPQFQQLIIIHTVLSTVSITLLIALTVIYLRVYAETGARFSLGITVVLFALLVQALVQYPLLEGLFVPFGEGQGSFLTSADLFSIAAYTVFLYLSLE